MAVDVNCCCVGSERQSLGSQTARGRIWAKQLRRDAGGVVELAASVPWEHFKICAKPVGSGGLFPGGRSARLKALRMGKLDKLQIDPLRLGRTREDGQ